MAKEVTMDEMIEDGLRDQVISMNNPNCVDCAECCSMATMLTDDEFEMLKKYLKKDKFGKFLYQEAISLINRHWKKGVVYWLCPFSHDKRCRIYKIRPQMCRQFHCDSPETSKDFKKTYPSGSKTIAELFIKDAWRNRKKN